MGYGRDAKGKFAMRFGPLGMEGGERRLNVLISRAKQRCRVFASITDEDMDTERARGRGVFALKLFLHFARTGRLAMSRAAESKPAKNTFANQVASALQARGGQVHPQVGIAGCFVDLGVVDPAVPGRYVLGIECDGPSYRDARSARDRDRLRSAVLEDHGWILHRIWSVDWLHRPQEQLERTINAIARAREQLTAAEGNESPAKRSKLEVIAVEREDLVEWAFWRARPGSYNAEGDILQGGGPRLPNRHGASRDSLRNSYRTCAADRSHGSPLHTGELLVRMRNIWGLLRGGSRIQAAVQHAVQVAVELKLIEQQKQILIAPGVPVILRDRREIASPGLRRPELLPPQELRAGVLALVTESFGAKPEEAVRTISRQLGYAATSSQLRALILQAIGSLQQEGKLVTQSGLLVLP